jgi:2-(1,2-epoxy-1,2-dihydrophenyl)acetyl-CoA isomerase
MALAADFTICADDARFWAPFVGRGFTPDSGCTWLLPRRVGEVRAREMLLLGSVVSGSTAAEWGMVHSSVTPDDLGAAADDLVRSLANGPTVAIGLTKALLHHGRSLALDDALREESLAMELSSRSADFKEGFAAFREKRDPNFEGR